MRRDSFICVTWLIHMYDMTHSCSWHDSFMCVTGRIHCVTWLIYMCAMTHSYVTWLIHIWYDPFTCDTTHSHVTWLIHTWHEPVIYVPPLIHTCDVTHSYVCHDSFMCDMTKSYVAWLTCHYLFIREMTQSYTLHCSFILPQYTCKYHSAIAHTYENFSAIAHSYSYNIRIFERHWCCMLIPMWHHDIVMSLLIFTPTIHARVL